MKINSAKLKKLIKEELVAITTDQPIEEGAPADPGANDTGAPAPGAQDAGKALAEFALTKTLDLAKGPLTQLAQKGDDVAKWEFITILASKLGIDIKQDVAKLGAMQTRKSKARAAGE